MAVHSEFLTICGYVVLPTVPILTFKCEDWVPSQCFCMFLHALSLHILHISSTTFDVHLVLIQEYVQNTEFGSDIVDLCMRQPALARMCWATSPPSVRFLRLFSWTRVRAIKPPLSVMAMTVSSAGLWPSGFCWTNIVFDRCFLRIPWKHFDYAGVSISDTIPAA